MCGDVFLFLRECEGKPTGRVDVSKQHVRNGIANFVAGIPSLNEASYRGGPRQVNG